MNRIYSCRKGLIEKIILPVSKLPKIFGKYLEKIQYHSECNFLIYINKYNNFTNNKKERKREMSMRISKCYTHFQFLH